MAAVDRSNHPYCDMCVKNVFNKKKVLYCKFCRKWIHLSCTVLTQSDCCVFQSGNNDWICLKCTTDAFPFAIIDDDVDYLNALFIHNIGYRSHWSIINNAEQ